MGVGLAESGVAQSKEAVDIPLLDIVGAGINIYREIKEVRHGQRGTRLQYVEPFQNKDVGLVYFLVFPVHNVIGDMRIKRRLDQRLS